MFNTVLVYPSSSLLSSYEYNVHFPRTQFKYLQQRVASIYCVYSCVCVYVCVFGNVSIIAGRYSVRTSLRVDYYGTRAHKEGELGKYLY